ncbi:MAG: hypothetical protein K2K02_08940 [Ruminococcus sp.]|nr:hypothetical protein [Ruminococcus sp.]
MAEKKENTPISFRADDETKKKFEEASAEFENKNIFMQTLLNLYSMDKAGATLSGQETSIKNFQALVNSLVREYTHSLELTANAENRVRDEFSVQLESKDSIISDLQKRLTETEQTAEQTVSEVENLKEQLQQKEEAVTTADEKVKQLEASLADKQTIIEGKDKTIITMTEEINSLKDKIENVEAVQNENSTLIIQLEELRKEYDSYKRQTELEKQTAEIQKQAEIAKAVADEKARGFEQTQLQMSSFINSLQIQKQKNTKKISETEISETENVEEFSEGQLTFYGDGDSDTN